LIGCLPKIFVRIDRVCTKILPSFFDGCVELFLSFG